MEELEAQLLASQVRQEMIHDEIRMFHQGTQSAIACIINIEKILRTGEIEQSQEKP